MPSLFNSLSIGRTALAANQHGLEVAGDNIANATTEGFARRRAEFVPAPSQNLGFAQVGTGVFLSSVRRVVDLTVEASLRDSTSLLSMLEAQTESLERVEDLFNAQAALESAFGPDSAGSLAADIGSKASQFFAALQKLSISPDSGPLRTSVVESGLALVRSINQVANSLVDARDRLDDLIEFDVREINTKIQEVAALNAQILKSENGGANTGQANDLRDRRGKVLLDLAEYMDVRVVETAQGSANVYLRGETLVFGDDYYKLSTRLVNEGSNQVSHVELELSGVDVSPQGGKLAGHQEARDQIVPEYQYKLDELARRFSVEFNKIHSEGAGILRHAGLTSEIAVPPANVRQVPLSTPSKVDRVSGIDYFTATELAALGSAVSTVAGATPYEGLQVLFTSGRNAGERRTIMDFDLPSGRVTLDRPLLHVPIPGDAFEITGLEAPIQDGAFELKVFNENTGVQNTVVVPVERDKLANGQSDVTLEGLVNAINTAIRGEFTLASGDPQPIRASITADRRLTIEASDDQYTFAFGKDSSDILAAIGLNTFFKGTDARSLNLTALVQENAAYVATSSTGAPGDNTNVLGLANLENVALYSGKTETIGEFFIGVASTIAVRTDESRDLTANQRVLTEQLINQREQISGVNIDEEAISLITYQRGFQAAARFISIVDQLLNTLINAT